MSTITDTLKSEGYSEDDLKRMTSRGKSVLFESLQRKKALYSEQKNKCLRPSTLPTPMHSPVDDLLKFGDNSNSAIIISGGSSQNSSRGIDDTQESFYNNNISDLVPKVASNALLVDKPVSASFSGVRSLRQSSHQRANSRSSSRHDHRFHRVSQSRDPNSQIASLSQRPRTRNMSRSHPSRDITTFNTDYLSENKDRILHEETRLQALIDYRERLEETRRIILHHTDNGKYLLAESTQHILDQNIQDIDNKCIIADENIQSATMRINNYKSKRRQKYTQLMSALDTQGVMDNELRNHLQSIVEAD